MLPIPTMSPMDPRETITLTFDASAELPAGVTITGTGTPVITTRSGSDIPPSLVLSGVVVNSQPLTLGRNTMQPGCAVQAIASGGAFGSEYIIAIPCTTTDPGFSPVLKCVLPMMLF